MKSLITKYFYSLLVAVIAISLSSTNTVYAEQSVFQPKCLQLGIDVGRIAYYGFIRESSHKLLSYNYSAASRVMVKPTNPKYSGMQYEFNFAVQYKLLIVDLDFGFGSAEWKGKHSKKRSIALLGNTKAILDDVDSVYKTNGYYGKVGFDINFLTYTSENNAAFLGLRYCFSLFRDSLKTKLIYGSERKEYSQSKEVYTETVLLKDASSYESIDTYQPNARATWLEAVAGVRLKVIGPVFLGCNVRYKFWLDVYKAHKHEPYEILGWGLTSDPVDKTVFGYNFYVSIGLPIGSDEPYDRTVGRKEKPLGSLL